MRLDRSSLVLLLALSACASDPPPQQEQPPPAAETKTAKREMDEDLVQEALLGETLKEISRKTGQPIVVDREVKDKKVNVTGLKGLRWREAVDTLAKRSGCEVEFTAEATFVRPRRAR